ncbi:RNA-binding domain-containing protein [Holdemania massiliensis]|uniref:RNA-binding domain-containing protein n=1 Tax=Holdemania massiliensis TaxID=1468449 RepID=UPI001F05614B|nr:RNA-binding domain-containing protein [Holdemania massiliensis]MCH1940690.1 putative DNA binding domain-containing protein [Holdemania massiliensis]
MFDFENQDLEFKQEYTSDIRKDVIAFANAEGGTILIGIRKDRRILDVVDPDSVMLQIVNSLKDSIVPDIMPFVIVKTKKIEGKFIIVVDVSIGIYRPYYLKEKGLKPSGVYIRKGSSSQPMTDEGIREMIVQSSGKSYEALRSLTQELTFLTLSKELEKKSVDFSSSKMKTLKLIGDDGLYTNLAYLVSDQCEVTIKITLFQGTDKAVFRDRKEFFGSILKQLEEVYEFIDLVNKTKATFSGLDRLDKRDYPQEAVREALLNCIVHRDYSFSGSNIVNIYDDRIEFVSLGGLVPGLEMKSIFLGVSQSRNPNLAALFYRMCLIESYGTGISQIQRAYHNEERHPVFETAKGVFRVTLPNRNEFSELVRLESSDEFEGILEKQKNRILEIALKQGQVTRKDVEELLKAGSTKAFRLLRQLCEEGKLQSVGNGKLSHYVLK